MAAPKHFSEAEVEACLQIIRRFGEVSSACQQQCVEKLGRYVSPPTLRSWWRESLNPKRSHHKKQAQLRGGSAPHSAEVEGGEIAFAENQPDDLTGVSFVEKVERLLNRLTDRSLTQDQIDLISGVQLPKAIGGLVDTWLKLRNIDPQILELAGVIRAFLDVAEPAGLDPRTFFQSMTEKVRAKTAERAALIPGENPSLTLSSQSE